MLWQLSKKYGAVAGFSISLGGFENIGRVADRSEIDCLGS